MKFLKKNLKILKLTRIVSYLKIMQNCFEEICIKNLLKFIKNFLINQIRLSKLSISEISWRILYITINAL